MTSPSAPAVAEDRQTTPRRRPPTWRELGAIVIMAVTLAGLGGFLAGRLTAPGDVAVADTPAGTSATDAVGISSMGSPDAPVVVVEYSDFLCPYCQRHALETQPALVQRYIDEGLVRLEWRDFPAQGPMSMALAVAGRAAEQQGRFWEFHDAVFAQTERITDQAQISAVAQQAGLDMAAFDAAMADPELELAVRRDFDEGRSRGVTGTPAFFVNGRAVQGAQPLDVFVQLIEAELNGTEPTSSRTADPVSLGPEDAQAFLADAPANLQIVDVRTPEEVAEGTIVPVDRLLNLDYYQESFGADLMAQLDPDKPVFVYCRSGNRSGQTVEFLADQGFAEVYDLNGGIVAWQEAGLPVQ